MAQLELEPGSSRSLTLGFFFENHLDVCTVSSSLERKRSFVLAFCVLLALPSYSSFWFWPQVNSTQSPVVVYIGKGCGNAVGSLLKSQPPAFLPPPFWMEELLKWVRARRGQMEIPAYVCPPPPRSTSHARTSTPHVTCVCEIIEDHDLYVHEAGRGIDSVLITLYLQQL